LEATEKKKSRKSNAPGKAKKPKHNTLKKRSKKEREDEDKIIQSVNERGAQKAKERLSAHRSKREKILKETSKLGAKGKAAQRIIWVQISLWYKVQLYNGSKLEGAPYVNTVDSFVGIKYNANSESSWRKKLHAAQNELLHTVVITMESNAEIVEHYFSYVPMTSKKELANYMLDPSKAKMVSPMPIHYKFIPADLNVPEKGFICTDSYILKRYSAKIPSLCQEKLDDIMGKADPKQGRSCEDLDMFCDKYKISHYALDYKHKIFWKKVRIDSNYTPLMYYCMNNHMYPVTDPKTRESIRKRSAAKTSKSTEGTSLKASLNEKKALEEEDESIDLFDRPWFENVEMVDVLSEDYHDCNIFYHTHTLYPMLIELYEIGKFAYDCKYTAEKMTCIIIPEKGIHLWANMNHRTSNPDKKETGKHVPYDFKDVMVECNAMNIPFTNQSFTQLGKQVQERFHVKGKKKCLRVAFNAKQREMIWKMQCKKCSACKAKIDTYQIDHIIPLSQGGDNRFENLQALCLPCHKSKTNKETSERCFDTDNTQSDYNKNTLKVFATCKNGFIHNFDPEGPWEHRVETGVSHVLGFDITKCRTETALRMEYEWCVYSVFDDVEKFDKKKHKSIEPGVYRIVTNNYLPFKGTGWYTYNLVRKALADELIDLKDITHCVRASFTMPANYYAEFIKYVRENVDNKNLAKPIINMFIGSLGHKVSKTRKVFLTTSMNEASYHKFAVAEDENRQVHVKKSKTVGGLMEIFTNSIRYVESNHVPIFNQILDEEAWQLYEIKKLLDKHNCRQMIYYNTDNAIAEFSCEKDVNACREEGLKVFWDKEKKVPKYKVAIDIHNMERFEKDEHGDNLVEKLAAGEVDRPFTLHKPKYEQLYEDSGVNDFTKIVHKLVNDNLSFQIQGRAGTGKSFLLKRFIEYLKKKEMTYMALCPTHKACRSLDDEARTLHSRWAVIKNTGSDPFNGVDWVIIDEKSLVIEGFWKALLQILHRNPSCRFVICGDWDQLPCVGDRAEFDYENSSAMAELSDHRMVTLTACRRMNKSGQELFKMCKNVNAIDLGKFGDEECEKSVAYNNRVRIAVNHRWMMQQSKGKNYIEVKAIPGKVKETQDMRIYNGMPLIAIQSRVTKEYSIANAEEYRVMRFNKVAVEIAPVMEDGSVDETMCICMPVGEFPKLLQPAYCISIHRSQCSTFRVPYTIYQCEKMRKMDKDNGGDLGARLMYVALSRAADIKLINISHEY
jgi:5-methylcytosine-specific restriction endonuclease McrA